MGLTIAAEAPPIRRDAAGSGRQAADGHRIAAEAPPIRRDADGVYRVGNTRLLLDLVVEAFQRGESPEAIVEAYDVVTVADVYAVIAYYLRHKSEVDEYLAERERQAEKLWRQIESEQGDGLAELTACIQARRAAGG